MDLQRRCCCVYGDRPITLDKSSHYDQEIYGTFTQRSTVSKGRGGIAMDALNTQGERSEHTVKAYINEIPAKTQPRSATFMQIFRTWRDLWHRG